MVNSDTLTVVREYWLKYANYVDPAGALANRFKTQSKEFHETSPIDFKVEGFQALGRSFGPQFNRSTKVTEHYANHFWLSGTVENQKHAGQCNPLTVYSSTAGDRFAIHFRTNPLAGFHLAASLTKLAPDSPFFSRETVPQKNVLYTAKAQFQAWCKSFQDLAQSSVEDNVNAKLRIRFFVGDAINFCHVLNQHRSKDEVARDLYSRPWSTTQLRLDGKGYIPNTHDQAPLSFNVIDTSNLADEVGFVNVLVAAIPLLEQSPAAVLYTETINTLPYGRDQFSDLLSQLLCTEVAGNMSALLGVVPAPYITGVQTHSIDVAFINENTVVFNRINWKIATSIDPDINLQVISKMSFEPDILADFLYDVYLQMFIQESHEYYNQVASSKIAIIVPEPHYTRRSFAALLAFLKPRLNIDFERLMSALGGKIGQDNNLRVGYQNQEDLYLQLHLLGVYSTFPFDCETYPDFVTYGPHNDLGILKREDPPNVVCLVVTIPRSKLALIYEKCVDARRRVNLIFQIDILRKSDDDKHNTFSSVQPVFGTLVSAAGGETCDIEADAAGWFGEADLHLAAYVPTYLLLRWHPDDILVAVRIFQEMSASEVFREPLGVRHMLATHMEVFRVPLLSPEYIHVVENLPGLSRSNPPSIAIEPEKYAFSDESVEITYVLFVPDDQTFTTRITLKGKVEQAALIRAQIVQFHLISPCTVAVCFGKHKYTCSFPFPVSGNATRLRLARKSGWVEVITSLLPPQILKATPTSTRPVIYDERYGLCNWNAPYINFRQLPRLSASNNPGIFNSWLEAHLDLMVSDTELQTPATSEDGVGLMFWVKHSITSIFKHVATKLTASQPCVFNLTPREGVEECGGFLLFFVTGFYFDSNANSVVIEAYVVQVNQETLGNPLFRPIVKNALTSGAMHLREDVFMWWKRALPAMAEQCRDYEHSERCLFARGVPTNLEPEDSHVCSCGLGKVGRRLSESRYRSASPFATRVAISPLFPAAYIERTTRGMANTREGNSEIAESLARIELNPQRSVVSGTDICRKCGKSGTKKCGKCGLVNYCSRDCQRKDWKRHKAECQRTQEEQRSARGGP